MRFTEAERAETKGRYHFACGLLPSLSTQALREQTGGNGWSELQSSQQLHSTIHWKVWVNFGCLVGWVLYPISLSSP